MASLEETNDVSVSYTHNNSGIRTSKTIDSTTTEYTLIGGAVTFETDGTNDIYYR